MVRHRAGRWTVAEHRLPEHSGNGRGRQTITVALIAIYMPLVVNQAASGLFRSLVFAPGLLLITAALPTDRGATAMGMYVAGGFTSNIVLNTVDPFVVGPVGWRNVFYIAAAPSLISPGVSTIAKGGTVLGSATYSPASTSRSFALTSVQPGATYCFQVETTDNAANVSLGAKRCTSVPLDDAALVESEVKGNSQWESAEIPSDSRWSPRVARTAEAFRSSGTTSW